MKAISDLTFNLLRVVSSPFSDRRDKFDVYDYERLYRYALKNKMSLLYLETLYKIGKLGSLKEEYERLKAKYSRIENAISEISNKLKHWNIDYAFFKSIKPYEEVTVDIDILIFGSKYSNVIKEMKNAGYNLLAISPLSATFRDNDAGVDFDVYNEVGVSRIIYLDKNILTNFVDYKKLSNGEVVRSLRPEADLLAVIAHSVLKEQIYVLSEYYTTLYYLAGIRDENLNSIRYLVDKCKLGLVTRTHVGITAWLYKTIFGKLPICIDKLIKNFGLNSFELSCFKERGFIMPYKYHPLTVVNAFLEKIKEEKARRSLAVQALNMVRPQFTLHFVGKVLHHIKRKTY